MENIEQLLKPRYKILAGWPGNTRPIGFVFTMDKKDPEGYYTTTGYLQEKYFTMYPHLFRKLQWWEDRKPEEMPEYVKMEKVLPHARFNYGDILKVVKWLPDEDGKKLYFQFEGDPKGDLGYYPYDFLPATATEYNQYLKQKQ